jgi:S1-C subfamily serine protease
MKKLLILLFILVVVLGLWSLLASFFPNFNSLPSGLPSSTEKVKVVTEESVAVSVVKNVGPSTVTVVQTKTVSRDESLDPFGIFGIPNQESGPTTTNIGSGFIVSSDGTIVTNKHVVSETDAKYQIVTSNNKTYDVKNIYRDPLNDIALLKIDPSQNLGQILKPVSLGDSGKLEVGQFVVAIGTALGEFRNTVTTGVISGLGRGITAGDAFQGFVERLDNVIQTDAAINPGNSGGPLVNSAGQVIGINTAVSQSGQNIGFALPVNTVKESINNFNQNGQHFERPFLGVSYRILDKETASVNDLVEGAFIQAVSPDSPAEKAGVQRGDVITRFDGKAVNAQNELSRLIAGKKSGDTVTIVVWRDKETKELKATLGTAPIQ